MSAPGQAPQVFHSHDQQAGDRLAGLCAARADRGAGDWKLRGTAILPADRTDPAQPRRTRRIAEPCVVLPTASPDRERPNPAIICVFLAGHSDIHGVGRALRRADIGPHRDEAAFAFRIDNQPGLLATPAPMVGFAARKHARIAEPIRRLPGIARPAPVRRWLGAIEPVIAKARGAIGHAHGHSPGIPGAAGIVAQAPPA